MPISRNTARRVSRLARLDLTPEELDKISLELTQIVDYFERLTAVDTEGIKIGAGIIGSPSMLREDTVRPSLTVKQALANAPESKGGFFLTPRVL